MKHGFWISCLSTGLVVLGAAGLPAQEAPARGRPEPPVSPPPAISAPVVSQPVARQPIPAAARLVATSARIDPDRPKVGDTVRILAILQNQGNAASERGLELLVRCTAIRGGPECPSSSFDVSLSIVEPGKNARAMVDLGREWDAGQYRLSIGLDGSREAMALGLTVAPAPSLARAEQGLNPQPEPPSAQAPARVLPPTAGPRANPGRPAPETSPEAGEAEPPGPQRAAPPRQVPLERPSPVLPTTRPVPPPPLARAADRPLPSPPAPSVSLNVGPADDTAVQPSGAVPLPAGPSLAFAKPVVDQGLVPGGTTATVYKSGLKVQLIWSWGNQDTFDWRWQVALSPFPPTAGLTPLALLAEDEAPAGDFWIDLGSFPPLGGVAPPSPAASANGPVGEVMAGAQPPAAPPGGGETMQAVMLPPAGQKPTTGDLPPAIDEGDAGQPTSAVAGPKAAMTLGQPDEPVLPDAPIDFHIRLIPLKNGQPAGPPSNTVVAHYVPGISPADEDIKNYFEQKAAKEAKLAEMSEQARVYEVALLSWKPAVFDDPSQWGCIVVVKNPYYGEVHPLMGYKPGSTYCPEKDPSKMEKSTGEKILEGVEGFGKAWDGLGWAMDQAKQWIASKFAETFPCEWLGDDLESDCESVAKQVAEAAISAGLVAAGMPPALPSVAELQGMAEGKVVDGAVDYTCDAIEANGGTCTPEMRAALAKIYQEGLDQLQEDLEKQTQEPGCGDVQTAKDYGLLPLPCFNDFPGTEVKPAPGSVYESPQATVRVRRLKPDPGFPLACRMYVSLFLENYFPGGTVGGSFSSNQVPAGPIEGYPFKSGQAVIPGLSVGQTTVLAVPLGPKAPFYLPGNTWSPFQWEDWLALYRGGKGPLSAAVRTTQDIVTSPETGGYFPELECAEAATMNVQIPWQL